MFCCTGESALRIRATGGCSLENTLKPRGTEALHTRTQMPLLWIRSERDDAPMAKLRWEIGPWLGTFAVHMMVDIC